METLYKKVNMKDLLAQGLYLLMKQKSFEKITIKQICDKTGVIRGTFYNHFCDKFETLEYLTYQILLPNEKNIDFKEMLRISLEQIENNKEFFYEAFKIEGQNSFVDMLEHIFETHIKAYCNELNLDFSKIPMKDTVFYEYFSLSFVYIIKNWVCKQKDVSADKIFLQCEFIFKHSFFDIVSNKSCE